MTTTTTTATAALLAATPAEIDAALLDAEFAAATAGDRLGFAERTGQPTEALAAAKADADATVALLTAVYSIRGGWTRGYKVPGGHVHRSTACSTCHLTTVFVLIPAVSGLTDDEIVAAAGERACTVCYPDAPVATRTAPCTLFTAAEQADADRLAADRAARAAKAAEKATKAITDIDGGVLYGTERYDVLRTEVSAEREVVRLIADRIVYGYRAHLDTVDRITAALAAKRAVSVETAREQVMVKVAAKVARERKEIARNAW